MKQVFCSPQRSQFPYFWQRGHIPVALNSMSKPMLVSRFPQHHKYLVHSSILAFEPLAATPPLSNPRDLPTHTPFIAPLGLSLAILSLRPLLFSHGAPCSSSCSLSVTITLPHSLCPDAPEYFLSPRHSKNLPPQNGVVMSAVSSPFPLSHAVPCIEAKPGAFFPSSLCCESVGTPMGLPNHGSHLSWIHEERGKKVETHADWGSHSASFAGYGGRDANKGFGCSVPAPLGDTNSSHIGSGSWWVGDCQSSHSPASWRCL